MTWKKHLTSKAEYAENPSRVAFSGRRKQDTLALRSISIFIRKTS